MGRVSGNVIQHYYELTGEGPPLVFIHGAFGDSRLWDAQWKHFSSQYRLLRYDLRGHGRTGASDLDRYTMTTYADDLAWLLDAAGIENAVICGLSWGGAIAQVFAVNHPDRLRGLVLAGSTVSMSLTFGETLLRYVFFPKPAMMLVIRTLRVEDFVRFSFWLSNLTLGKEWLQRDQETAQYLRQMMLQIDRDEYRKIWGAIYGFNLQPLEKILCPTLVLNGEHDTKMVFRHTAEILQRITQAESHSLPGAYHAMTVENPAAFNRELARFLKNTL